MNNIQIKNLSQSLILEMRSLKRVEKEAETTVDGRQFQTGTQLSRNEERWAVVLALQ